MGGRVRTDSTIRRVGARRVRVSVAFPPSTLTPWWTAICLNEGAITFPNFGVGPWYPRIFADSGFFDVDKPLRDYTEVEWEQ